MNPGGRRREQITSCHTHVLHLEKVLAYVESVPFKEGLYIKGGATGYL